MATISVEQPNHAELGAIHRALRESYWSPGIPRDVVAKAFAHSLCALARDAHGGLIGFGRLVTDHATFAWLADVVVLPEHRGKGIGRELVRTLQAQPDVQNLRCWMLGTRDAHGVYAALGFTPIAAPDRLMEIRNWAPHGVATT